MDWSRSWPGYPKVAAVWCEMRFSARAVKTLPRTWFMSVTVLSLPEREANSAASLSDSRSCCSSRAWKMQRVGCPFLRSMRQERPSENWRRHLLLLESVESDFIGNLRKERICPAYEGGQAQRHKEHRDSEGNGFC